MDKNYEKHYDLEEKQIKSNKSYLQKITAIIFIVITSLKLLQQI